MHTDNSMVIAKRRGEERQKSVKEGQIVMEKDLTQGGKHTIQYTDDVLQNCIHETYNCINQCHLNKLKKFKKYHKLLNPKMTFTLRRNEHYTIYVDRLEYILKNICFTHILQNIFIGKMGSLPC